MKKRPSKARRRKAQPLAEPNKKVVTAASRTKSTKPASEAAKAAKSSSEPTHVLMRSRNESGQTFAAHARILASRGTVLLGKMGRPLADSFQSGLNEQMSRNVPTYLFLTTREGWNGPYVTEACRLRKVHSAFDPSRSDLVPSYYVNQGPAIKTWFEITDMRRLTREEMNRIFVVSSGRELMSVIRSSAATFRVGVRSSAAAS